MIGFQTRCLRNKYSLTKNNVLDNLRVNKGLVCVLLAVLEVRNSSASYSDCWVNLYPTCTTWIPLRDWNTPKGVLSDGGHSRCLSISPKAWRPRLGAAVSRSRMASAALAPDSADGGRVLDEN